MGASASDARPVSDGTHPHRAACIRHEEVFGADYWSSQPLDTPATEGVDQSRELTTDGGDAEGTAEEERDE